MTKPHQRGDKALFMGSAAALVKVGVAAAISNTRKTCILRQELQTKQRRWVARGTGGGAELVSEFLQQLQLTDQHQVQPTSSQTSPAPPPFDTPDASVDALFERISQVSGCWPA